MPQTASNLYITQTREVFYCNVKIKIPAAFSDTLLDKAFAVFEAIDLTYNSYQPGSHFSEINKHAGHWVEVDDNVIKMLKTLIDVARYTGGAFDITAMPLIKLWGFYNNGTKKIPSMAEIQEAIGKTGYQNIEIKDNLVKIQKGQEIITGSFIKSFAVDKTIQLLKNEGITDCIINAGGSTIYAINNSIHTHWGVNIPSIITEGQPIKIMLGNECFSLSARAHNYIEIKGKHYGHIINAATGHPSANQQCGVIADNAFIADVLSTALFSSSPENFNVLVEKLSCNFTFKAFLADDNGNIFNRGFKFKDSYTIQ